MDLSKNMVDLSNVSHVTDAPSPKLTMDQIFPVVKEILIGSHAEYLVAVFVLYIIIYFSFGFYVGTGDEADKAISRLFDYVMCFLGLMVLVYFYFSSPIESQKQPLTTVWNWSIDFYDDPLNFFSVTFFLMVYYILIMLVRIPMGDNVKPYTVQLIESKAWILVVTIIIYDFFKYALNMDLKHAFDIKDLNEVTVKAQAKEVFNVANNDFSFQEAQAVCKSYQSRLATYDEIEEAHQKGGEWCNYGWSDGQMAFFPTQKKTWQELQGKKLGNKCGRPGINGGYIPNARMRFGANCFGIKPKGVVSMSTKYDNPAPQTSADNELDKKAQYWAANRDKLNINSFNRVRWNS